MIRSLVSIRFRSMLAGLTAQARKKDKRSTGTLVLFAVLYVYLFAVIGGMMCLMFYSLAEAYHALQLDWLYFAMAGMIGLALALFGSVFTTQSQLYEAKDNAMLLSMPIPSRLILLSRMIPLLCLNLLFSGLVMVPAIVMYAVFVELSLVNVLLQLLGWLAVCVLAQALACFLGWLLHLVLSRLNKSLGSMLFMVAFLVIYFIVYSQANQILQAMASNGQQIARALESWVWPIYALGRGCLGSWMLLGFLAIAAGLFALVYWILSATFLRTATASTARRARRKPLRDEAIRTPVQAITAKELRKFLNCPVYLTNMGLGLVLSAALPVLGLVFRQQLLDTFSQLELFLPGLKDLIPVLICAVLAFSVSTTCISTPSVSLEGKNLWILKSMPVSSRDILLGKLRLHLILSVPISAISGLILGLTFGCDPIDLLFTTLIPALLSTFSGVLGMVAGLKWAKLDYISEAYPCKQSVSVLVSMFGLMGLPVLLGLGYHLLLPFLSPKVFLLACAAVLSILCWGFYRCLVTWGVQKWDSLY